MIYKCIIIDDEPHFTQLMEEYIQEIPELKLIKTFNDPLKAIAEMAGQEKIDIVFLDINMPHITGIELAPFLKKISSFLIFITGHAQYAVKAFDLEADDFLYKPFRLERLKQSIKKIANKTQHVQNSNVDELFYMKIAGFPSRYIKFLYKEIIAFESDKNYIKIYTPNNCHRVYLGLKDVEKRLTGRSDFIKIQRSFIISKSFVDQVDHNVVIMKHSNLRITIGKHYRDMLFEYLEHNKF
uniref:LytR/AlgR family response regulator transcription factor n=1 Tax=Pedobacter schmidteae TaxID=2201271 RepID=UPI000EB33BEF|nr:LytTR family DNA-binding domain-containing protein [Pedobacter schmidteae]